MFYVFLLSLLASISIGLSISVLYDIDNYRVVTMLNVTAFLTFSVMLALTEIVRKKINELIEAIKASQPKPPQ